MKALFALFATLALQSCIVPGYKTVPEQFRLGLPIMVGGPSMVWKFEPIQEQQ